MKSDELKIAQSNAQHFVISLKIRVRHEIRTFDDSIFCEIIRRNLKTHISFSAFLFSNLTEKWVSGIKFMRGQGQLKPVFDRNGHDDYPKRILQAPYATFGQHINKSLIRNQFHKSNFWLCRDMC
jgi:hypothetical protein